MNAVLPLSGRVGVPPAGFCVSRKKSFVGREILHVKKSWRTRDAFAGGQDAHFTRNLTGRNVSNR